MPTYSWQQTDAAIEVVAQIQGVDRKLLQHTKHYTITPIFFSLNAPPFLFQLDFEREIDPFRIKIVIPNKKDIQFVFPKKEPYVQWTNLLSNKPKEQRLAERMASIDQQHAKRQAIREQRAQQKKIRLKAAQRRQWDQEKYLKLIVNRLESEEKHREVQGLEQWADDTTAGTLNLTESASDDVKCGDDAAKSTAVRRSEAVEVGFTEWDYVLPVREHSKPPGFARKTVPHRKSPKRDDRTIEERSAELLCADGAKLFWAGDYEAAINAFSAAIALDDKFLEAYCSRFQCHIAVIVSTADDLQYDEKCIERDLEKMESIRTSDRYVGTADFAAMIISLQKGIMATPILLDELRNTACGLDIDDDRPHSIGVTLDRGLKMHQMRHCEGTLANSFGIFQNEVTHRSLHELAVKCKDIADIVQLKQNGDRLMRDRRCTEAVEVYSAILRKFAKYTDDDCHSFLKRQCLNNRSTAWFVEGQFMRCIADCDTLFALNDKHCTAVARRGAAFLSLWKRDREQKEYLECALKNYRTAATLNHKYNAHATKINNILLSF